MRAATPGGAGGLEGVWGLVFGAGMHGGWAIVGPLEQAVLPLPVMQHAIRHWVAHPAVRLLPSHTHDYFPLSALSGCPAVSVPCGFLPVSVPPGSPSNPSMQALLLWQGAAAVGGRAAG